ncbi:AraC family transcriptional regulator [Castellaniella sp.]
MDIALPTYALYGQKYMAVEPNYVHMETLADFRVRLQDTMQAHRHLDLAHLIWVGEGSIHALLEGRYLDVGAPAVIVVPAPAIHAFRVEPDARGMALTLSQGLMLNVAAHLQQLKAWVLEPPRLIPVAASRTDPVMARLFDSLWHEYRKKSDHYQAAFFSHILQIFVELARQQPAENALAPLSDQKHWALYQDFHALVERHYATHRRISDYAPHLSVSERTLQRACQAISGLTPQQIVQERVMLEARRLLAYTDRNINTIAYQLGFDDPGYFSHFFARHADLTPAQYRQATQPGGPHN